MEDVVIRMLKERLSEDVLQLALEVYRAFIEKGRRGVRELVASKVEEVVSVDSGRKGREGQRV